MMFAFEQAIMRRAEAIKAQVELVNRQIMELRADCATASDQRGIAMAPPAEVAVRAAPPAASGIKPAIAGLGVTASGDHRLGRF
jgi:hypothetical protein